MRSASTVVLVLALAAGFWALGQTGVAAQVQGNDNNIAIMDDCLPGDPAWNPTGAAGSSRMKATSRLPNSSVYSRRR
jgi:hypothetical protein